MTALIFQPPVIAHRGASMLAPENTMIAFAKAVQSGIRWIELDVMLSADGVPIIFHDETLARLTPLQGAVYDYPAAFLFSLDVGSWSNAQYAGERIPSLEHVLAFVNEQGVSLNIELKPLPGMEADLVRAVTRLLAANRFGSNTQLLLSSFSIPVLRYLHAHHPDYARGFLLHEWSPDWEKELSALECVTLGVYERLLTLAQVGYIKKQFDVKLLSYTVNTIARARELLTYGVDAIFSDDVALAQQLSVTTE